MDKPTPTDIRLKSNVVFAEYGYPEIDPDADPPEIDRLTFVIDESLAEIDGILMAQGYSLDIAAVDDTTSFGILLGRAIRMMTEFNAGASQHEIVDTAADFDLLSSWSAGPVSENRRNIGPNAAVWHPWPALNKLLHGLLVVGTGGTLLSNNVPIVGILDPLVPKPGSPIMDRWVLDMPQQGLPLPWGIWP